MSWGMNDKDHSVFTGEIGRKGYRVPEPFLDDRFDEMYRTELRIGKIFAIFAIIAW